MPPVYETPCIVVRATATILRTREATNVRQEGGDDVGEPLPAENADGDDQEEPEQTDRPVITAEGDGQEELEQTDCPFITADSDSQEELEQSDRPFITAGRLRLSGRGAARLGSMARLHLTNEFETICRNLKVTPEKSRCNLKSQILDLRREKHKIVRTAGSDRGA